MFELLLLGHAASNSFSQGLCKHKDMHQCTFPIELLMPPETVWHVRPHTPDQALQEELNRIEEDNPSEQQGYTEEDGRVGDARVIMSDRGAGHPRCCLKTGKVESTSNFGTAIGTAGVITGKWM